MYLPHNLIKLLENVLYQDKAVSWEQAESKGKRESMGKIQVRAPVGSCEQGKEGKPRGAGKKALGRTASRR